MMRYKIFVGAVSTLRSFRPYKEPTAMVIRFCSSSNSWHLMFPDMADTKEATVERWLKKEGESFTTRDVICEVSLFPSELTIGLNANRSGIVAKLLVPTGKKLLATEHIALLVADQTEYNNYMDEVRENILDEEVLAETTKIIEESKQKPDAKVLLRQIRHLMQEGEIDEHSEFATKLLSFARKGNLELLSLFEASFEGTSFDYETFDKKFFVENARQFIMEQNQEAQHH